MQPSQKSSTEFFLHSVTEDADTVRSMLMDTPEHVIKEGIKIAHDMI
jgi:hypothetical protein